MYTIIYLYKYNSKKGILFKYYESTINILISFYILSNTIYMSQITHIK